MLVYRHLWQLFESVRQHFISPSAANSGGNRAATDGIDAASQKAVVDSVRAALGETIKQQEQEQQGNSLECPAPQQSQSSTDRTNRRSASGVDVPQAGTRDAGNDDANQPNMCEAAPPPVQGEANTVHRTHPGLVDSCASKRKPDALAQRRCPVFGHPAVQEVSLCHLLDAHDDHHCAMRAHCGVDSVTCRARECSVHAFCQEEAR